MKAALRATFVALGVGLMGFAAPAVGQTVSAGFLAHQVDLAAARYRSLANTGGDEIYLGIPDLGGAPPRRSQRNITWVLGANDVTLQYDALGDLLTTTVTNSSAGSPYTLVYTNLAAQAAFYKGNAFTLVDLNLMQLTVTLRDAGSSVSFDNVTLDSNPLGSFAGVFSGGQTWTVTDYDFGQGFTLSGTINLSGLFSGGQESSKIDILFGHLNICGDGVVEPGEPCDDGNTIDGDCCSSTCQLEANGSPCADDSETCTADVCDGAGACTHPAGHSGTECRNAAGDCDAPEVCDGASPTCPADDVKPEGTVCRIMAGVCDVTETCDGVAVDCPADEKSTSSCRPAAGLCDAAESCNGVGNDCPPDLAKPDNDSCSDGLFCNGPETCLSGQCEPGNEPCALLCNEGLDTCEVGCTAGPQSECAAADKNLLLVKRKGGAKDKLIWKWVKGAATEPSNFADPTDAADYAFCVYAGTMQSLVADAVVPAGATNWKAISKGYKYKEHDGTEDGIQKILLKGGSTAGKSKIIVKGKGAALPDPSLPLAAPVLVQLINGQNNDCWQSSFDSGDEIKNGESLYKAKNKMP